MIRRQPLRTGPIPTPLANQLEEMKLKLRPTTSTTTPEADLNTPPTPVMPENLRLIPKE